MSGNVIHQVKRVNLFENFEPRNTSQRKALDVVQQLASSVIDKADHFHVSPTPFAAMPSSTSPLANGCLWVISGGPGRGKTHLIEAFINEIADKAPKARDSIYLLRSSLTLHGLGLKLREESFDRKPIIIIDDAYSDKQSIDDLHPKTDLPVLMDLIACLYDTRALCLMTTNFSFLKGILPRIKALDNVGRAYSRCKELLSTSGNNELILKGPDYREILARRAVTRNRGKKGKVNLEFLGGARPV